MKTKLFPTAVALAAICYLPTPAATGAESVAKALERANLQAKAKVIKALVNVRPVSEVYSGGVKQNRESIGSGIIFDGQGHIVTNYHVAGKASRVICTLYNSERVEAKLIGGDALTDIAGIKISERDMKVHGLKPAKLGESAKLTMGQIVFAFGSPMALSRTMTAGIVSNPKRYLSDKARLPTGEKTGLFNTWIQTDAAINPGNSGGPLVNLDGEVVGINARIVGFANNLGFAIPIDIVKDVVRDLVAKGRVDRSWLGIEFQPMEEIGAARDQKGVLVGNIAPGSPAAKAGLRVGDVMVQYEGQPTSARFIEDTPAIAKMVADTPVGRSVTLKIVRDGATLTLHAKTVAMGRLTGKDMECREWGITIKDITDQMVLDMRLEDATGVVVSGVKTGSYANVADVQTDDVLREVAGTPISTLDDFQKVYKRILAEKPASVFIKLNRRNSVKYAVIKAKYDAEKK